MDKDRSIIPRRAETKASSLARVVYACGECGAQKNGKVEADACCICPKCKRRIVEPPEHAGWHRDDKCRRCAVKERIRARRDDIRRAKDILADKEKSLADLLAEKSTLDGAEKVTLEE